MITEEEATAIVETATDKEIEAAAHLWALIFSTIGAEPPERLPSNLKALAIETVRSIAQVPRGIEE